MFGERRTVIRMAAITYFVVVAAVGTLNLAHRLEFPIEVADRDGKMVVEGVRSGSDAEKSGVRVGDVLVSVGDLKIDNSATARWALRTLESPSSKPFRIERNGSIINLIVPPEAPYPVSFVVLNTLLAVTFFFVGIMVWWSGEKDPAARSLFRLNAFAGTAIVLFSHENTYSSLPLHYGYTALWLLTYTLTPPALVEFLHRFCRSQRQFQSQRLLYRAPYVPLLIVFLGLAVTYHLAFSTWQPVWITWYETLFNVGFGILLLIYFTVGILLLLWNFLRPANQAERDRARWLLFCTLVGLTPFFFLNKLPVLLGLKPFVPLWATFSLMLIVPIGWGMAVASFRMLKLEWVLSRTIIYVIAVALAVYLIATLSMMSFEHFEHPTVLSLAIMLVIGSLMLVATVTGFITHIRHIIDRIYYRDWYRYEGAVQDLGSELSASLTESGIADILTSRLPALLRIERAVLIISKSQQAWHYPPQAATLLPEDKAGISRILIDLGIAPNNRYSAEALASAGTEIRKCGYQLLLPLYHGGRATGMLLLGRKTSGASFSLRDRQLLETISSYAGTALANLALTQQLLENEKRAVAVDMAGGIAHEINNALAPLMGQAQLMEIRLAKQASGPVDSTLQSPLQIIVEMCQRIKRIALNLSRISEPSHLEIEELSLNSVVEETLQIMTETTGRIKHFRSDNPNAKYQLRIELSSDLPTIQADRQQLSQVLLNLMINASDAMEPLGKGTLSIGTRFDPVQQSVIGYVADTGVGIPAQHLEKVFQPYFTTKEKGKGTGLGLAIVRSIVDAHGGKLTIQSTEGHGTRVEFSLPISGSNYC